MVVTVGIGLRLLAGPKMVARVNLRNETPFELTITASDRPTGAVTPLGLVGPHATAPVAEVIDEGDVWYFHVSAEGMDGGTLTQTRPQLTRSGWTLVVGGEIEARLRRAGLTA
jgi:hypothetical protein